MRCLSLANALRKKGGECKFICRAHQGNLLELIHKQGFDVLVLPEKNGDLVSLGETREQQTLAHANWLGVHWRTDAEATREVLGDADVDWLIIDHYALDVRWESVLRSECKKNMVIDDIADRIHDCDLLLDQNLVENMTSRYMSKVPSRCELMLGPGFALLQPQYAELHSRVPPRDDSIQRIMVYFGGADTDNLTGMAISAFFT